ncbi:hypothetical protein CPT_Mendera_114 [Stenotrophomonas phage Mendera]|uniref:Glutaredoxin domain-containing protein n=3 Tax=Menderavirus TaxID=2843421 RepID=A0A482IEK0_9CAUD|nr:thioredoxin domain [Stenotrophomonas phage YB07]YP_009851168.1 thioredoxin domain [Stenotrophomonas phage Mendera]YP_010667685.1 thioredoxin domain [Stenotrophomonas maltophilia phage vB_SmaM_Ps15]QXN67481.1 hypothetical protein [Stenotrophomonas phage BUCT608]QYW02657.1 glutaredoxin [Stenotrophomonas phage Marzo]QBP06307.1 thioredoxin domain [Stenotrophomonas phage YB07]QFR56660.1 hypothetical protein CPT_Mendera_114 [Stenotrophomonas phage Mendera]QYC97619.1 hypothetical protein [Stenot
MIVLYSMDGCPQCVTAENILKQRGLDYEVKKVGRDITRDELVALLPVGERQMPQFEIDGKIIGSINSFQAHMRGNQ